MLTGSHCIQWTATGTGWVKFTPSYFNGSAPFGVGWAQRVISWLKADGSDGLSDLETAFDYVVVVLDSNIGDLTGFTGYRTYSSSWNNGNFWDQLGYPGDLTGGQRPVFFDDGAITSSEPTPRADSRVRSRTLHGHFRRPLRRPLLGLVGQ